MFDSGLKPWLVLAGPSLEKERGIVCVRVCECVHKREVFLYVCELVEEHIAEECIVHAAVGPHKHDTREEKHICPVLGCSWRNHAPCPTVLHQAAKSPPWASALTASPPPRPGKEELSY